jgi:hypothetical protein
MPTQRADHHQKRRPVRDLGLIRGEVGILRYIALCLSSLHWRHLRACYSRQAFPEIPGAEHMCTSAGAAPLDRPEEDHRRLRFKGNIPMNLMLLCWVFFSFFYVAFSVESDNNCVKSHASFETDPGSNRNITLPCW